MIRHRLGLIAAATAGAVVVGIAACGDTIKDAGDAPLSGAGGAASGGSGNGGGSTGSNIPSTCTAACCPTSVACYSSSAGQTAPGAECMALRDNTGKDHIQMRQAWIRATTPRGNADSIIYGVLAGRTELPMKDCYQGRGVLGTGDSIQVVDFFLGGSRATPPDIAKDYGTIGFATQVTAANLTQTLTEGFCNGRDDDYSSQIAAGYALKAAEITPPDLAFPPGMPVPMGAADHPWKVGPTKGKRVAVDFDVSDAEWRKDTLAKFADGGEYAKDGFNGIFFYDDAKGYAHGYAPMGWLVIYAPDGKSHLAIPIREPDARSKFNDPTAPNCVGTFRGDVLDTASSPKCGSTDPRNPAWGSGNCGDHLCDPSKSEAPATTDGYFLITELEQLYSTDLQKTLCVSYPGSSESDPTRQQVDAEGFFNPSLKSCRSAKWDPTKPGNAGIPKGDWCAATNTVATPTCHDAWRSHSIHVFSAANVKVGDATNPVVTCRFQP